MLGIKFDFNITILKNFEKLQDRTFTSLLRRTLNEGCRRLELDIYSRKVSFRIWYEKYSQNNWGNLIFPKAFSYTTSNYGSGLINEKFLCFWWYSGWCQCFLSYLGLPRLRFGISFLWKLVTLRNQFKVFSYLAFLPCFSLALAFAVLLWIAAPDLPNFEYQEVMGISQYVISLTYWAHWLRYK